MESKIIKSLDEIWDKYEKIGFKDELVNRVLFDGRKYVFPVPEPDKKILVVGANPTYQEKDKKKQISYKYSEVSSPYFTTIQKTVGYHGEVSYQDLFYFRTNDQEFLNLLHKEGDNGLHFITEQLDLTQHTIESCHPKLIIVLNEAIWTFWGMKPEFVWMGYKFEKVEDLVMNGGLLMRITGFRESPLRIAKDLHTTNLEGTLVYFSSILNRTNSEFRQRITKDIEKIYL